MPSSTRLFAPAVRARSARSRPIRAAPKVTTPKEHFGFNIGDDYCLANYKQFAELPGRSSRRSPTGSRSSTSARPRRGRPQLMAIVTSPANHKKLDRYREIARKLARAEGVDDRRGREARRRGQGRRLDRRRAARQRSALRPGADRDASTSSSAGTDAETLRILDDVIILFVHANPDGTDLVADWYMREQGPEEAVARPACRGSTRSTSATTTTATSTPTRRPRRRT